MVIILESAKAVFLVGLYLIMILVMTVDCQAEALAFGMVISCK